MRPVKCPYCGHEEDKVIESRSIDDGAAIRRRRECLKCEKRYTTYERIEEVPIMVIKKDGRREPYSRDKILHGVIKACEKRPVSMEAIENLINDVEKKVGQEGKEVPTTVIGELVMEGLQKLDEVAYIRFASVYREFKDVREFVKEIRELQ